MHRNDSQRHTATRPHGDAAAAAGALTHHTPCMLRVPAHLHGIVAVAQQRVYIAGIAGLRRAVVRADAAAVRGCGSGEHYAQKSAAASPFSRLTCSHTNPISGQESEQTSSSPTYRGSGPCSPRGCRWRRGMCTDSLTNSAASCRRVRPSTKKMKVRRYWAAAHASCGTPPRPALSTDCCRPHTHNNTSSAAPTATAAAAATAEGSGAAAPTPVLRGARPLMRTTLPSRDSAASPPPRTHLVAQVEQRRRLSVDAVAARRHASHDALDQGLRDICAVKIPRALLSKGRGRGDHRSRPWSRPMRDGGREERGRDGKVR